MWPWKVPIVNTTDAAVTCTLLILLGQAKQDGGSNEDFDNILSMVLLGSKTHHCITRMDI